MATLAGMLRKNAERYGRKTALIFGNKRISYRQLSDSVNRLANGLKELGIKNGQKVSLLLFNSPEFVISYFAIVKLGAIVVPLNNMFKAEELKYIMEDSDSSLLITSSGFYDTACQLRFRLEKLANIIIVDKNLPDTIALSAIYENYSAEYAGAEPKESGIAAILYTSGTTGKPKGAMLTHHNLLSNASLSAEAIGASERDNIICMLPMFHSFACTTCVILPLSKGARITIIESPRPFSNVIKSILRNRITVFMGVPSIFNILKDVQLPGLFRLPLIRLINPLRLCISGAAALPVETLKKFEKKLRLPLLEGYGLTEASPVVSINPLKGTRKPGSIGLPLPGVEVAIASEDGKMLGAEEVGELLVRGPNVMSGYFKLPEDTEKALRDGWLWTGDMAKKDKEGYIYIVDRKKDMVNVRGLNVYPKEIEELLYQHPKVAEVAVIGVSDEHKGEVPKAYVTLKEGQKITASEVIRFCRDRIAPFKVPKYVEFRDSLPKNATGKILKTELRKDN